MSDGDDDSEAPPLPTAALEVLSDLLTGLAMRSADATQDGSPRQSLGFCVNCCRPLPTPPKGAEPKACRGCGHHPSRDAEVLGDAHSWVAAYEQQLHLQQEQQQRQPQGGSESGGVLLASDPQMLLHRSSLPPYPGRPERLQAIMSRLHASGLMSRCRLLPCRPAAEPELLAVHSRELVAAVRAMGAARGAAQPGPDGCECGGSGGGEQVETSATASPGGASSSAPASPCCSSLSPDTLYNAHTGTAALLAAGAAADVGAALVSGAARRALAVVRPPGAQAGVDQARGGCYLNNVAVAAASALQSGARRVLIVDWDVHHGRGTAEIFADDPRVLVFDMHRYDRDVYPGSGAVEDVGEGAGEGATLNLAFGSGGLTDGDLLGAALHVLLPVAHQFRPDVVLVAAGFGALHGDPIGGCACSPAVFAHLTHLLSGVAPRGLGLLLEGGYNLAATADAAEGCLRVLLGEAPPPLPGPWATTRAGWVGIMNAMQIHSQYWSCLHPLSLNGWLSAVNEQQRQMQEAEQAEALQGQAQGQRREASNASASSSASAAASLGDAAAGGYAAAFGLDSSDNGLTATAGGSGAGGAAAGHWERRAEEGAVEADPADVLDFFLGTGGGGGSDGSSSRGAGGHSVGSLSMGDEDLSNV